MSNTQVFVDLNNLLNEICLFLSEETNVSETPEVKCKINELITRSKTQIETIHLLQTSTDTESQRYVDMKGQPILPTMYLEFDKSREDIYSDITEDDTSNVVENTINSKDTCPYNDIKTTDLKHVRKKGLIARREKRFLIDTSKKYFALVLDNWLLLYNKEGSSQIVESLPLDRYQAAETGDQSKTPSFLVSDKITTFTFYAVNRKDVTQWITAINLKKRHTAKFSLLSTVTCSDISTNPLQVDEEVEVVYEVLKDDVYEQVEDTSHTKPPHINGHPTSNKDKVSTPPVPPRTVSIKLTAIKSLPPPPLPEKTIRPISEFVKSVTTFDKPADVTSNVTSKDTSNVKSNVMGIDNEDIYDTVTVLNQSVATAVVQQSEFAKKVATVTKKASGALADQLNRLLTERDIAKPHMSGDSIKQLTASSKKFASADLDEYYDTITTSSKIIVSQNQPQNEILETVDDSVYDSVVNILPTTLSELKTKLNERNSLLAVQNGEDNVKENVKVLSNVIAEEPEIKTVKVKSSRTMRQKFYPKFLKHN